MEQDKKCLTVQEEASGLLYAAEEGGGCAVPVSVEQMIEKAQRDTEEIFDMMGACFDKKIGFLGEWLVVEKIISDVTGFEKDGVSEDMVGSFINEFNRMVNGE